MTETQHGTDRTPNITHPSASETLVVRTFDGSPERLFTLWTTPELVVRWWSDHGPMTVCDIDLRVGGAWRWGHTNEEHGVEVTYSGVYRTVDAPTVLAFSEAFELMPGSDYENVITFDPNEDGTTTVTEHMTYTSQEWRDGHRASGFDAGITAAFERIDALLADGSA